MWPIAIPGAFKSCVQNSALSIKCRKRAQCSSCHRPLHAAQQHTSTKQALSQRKKRNGTASACSRPVITAGGRVSTGVATALLMLLTCRLLMHSRAPAAALGEATMSSSASSMSCVVRCGSAVALFALLGEDARIGELRPVVRWKPSSSSAAMCAGILDDRPKEMILGPCTPPAIWITSCRARL